MMVDDNVQALAVSAIRLLGVYLGQLPPEQSADGLSRLASGDLGFRAVVDVVGNDVRVQGYAIDGSGDAHRLFSIDWQSAPPPSSVQ